MEYLKILHDRLRFPSDKANHDLYGKLFESFVSLILDYGHLVKNHPVTNNLLHLNVKYIDIAVSIQVPSFLLSNLRINIYSSSQSTSKENALHKR